MISHGPVDISDDSPLWNLYDAVAECMAKRGLSGKIGDPLPNLMDARVVDLINADPESFERRVREMAYGLSMAGVAVED